MVGDQGELVYVAAKQLDRSVIVESMMVRFANSIVCNSRVWIFSEWHKVLLSALADLHPGFTRLGLIAAIIQSIEQTQHIHVDPGAFQLLPFSLLKSRRLFIWFVFAQTVCSMSPLLIAV